MRQYCVLAGIDLFTWDPKFGWGQIIPSLAFFVSSLALYIAVKNYQHGKATKTFDIQAKFEDRLDAAPMLVARKTVAAWWAGGRTGPLPRSAALSIANFFESVGAAWGAGAIAQEYLFVYLADWSRAYYEALRVDLVVPQQALDKTYFAKWSEMVKDAESFATKQGSAMTNAQICALHMPIDASRVLP
jgi:hypothetical protein